MNDHCTRRAGSSYMTPATKISLIETLFVFSIMWKNDWWWAFFVKTKSEFMWTWKLKLSQGIVADWWHHRSMSSGKARWTFVAFLRWTRNIWRCLLRWEAAVVWVARSELSTMCRMPLDLEGVCIRVTWTEGQQKARWLFCYWTMWWAKTSSRLQAPN